MHLPIPGIIQETLIGGVPPGLGIMKGKFGAVTTISSTVFALQGFSAKTAIRPEAHEQGKGLLVQPLGQLHRVIARIKDEDWQVDMRRVACEERTNLCGSHLLHSIGWR
jgi:hypothetical protein